MSDEMMSGRMNIFNIRIRISPGKLMRIIDCGERLANRPKKPRPRPTKTPAIVNTRSMLLPIHSTTCIYHNMQ